MIATQIATIERSDVEVLRRQFRGALLRPAEEGYDEARRVWNGAIDRHPARQRVEQGCAWGESGELQPVGVAWLPGVGR